MQPVVDSQYILNARDIVRQVYIDEKIKDYVLDLVIGHAEPELRGRLDAPEVI